MKKFIAVAALAAVAGAANAQLSYSTSGSYLDPIDANDVPLFSSGLEDALISTALAGTLTVSFLGKEASHDNVFEVAGTPLLSILNGVAPGVSGSTFINAGDVPFRFLDNDDSTSVPNGGNSPSTSQGGYVIFGKRDPQGQWTPMTMYNSTTYDLIIGFNDGAKVDADYDDHVFGLTMAPIPEPSTYALMAAGLAAVGFVARRRKPLA